MDPVSDRYRRGVDVLQRLSGESIEQVTNKVAEIAPDFARMTIEFPFGDLYSRGVLDLRTREAAAISALASLGRIPQLRVHVAAALNLGITREEIVELLMQISIYAGFPPALNALAECHDLLVNEDGKDVCEDDSSACSAARLRADSRPRRPDRK